MAAARGLPIPPADEVPPELEYKITPQSAAERTATEKSMNNLTVPISARSQSYNSDTSSSTQLASPTVSPSFNQSPEPPGNSTGQFFRGRAKTLASLTTSSKNSPPTDLAPREFQLPHDPFVNGQPIEVYLYKNASECPICFLYYPPYLNRTRCCDQPICSECFVQIKRPDPHPPEHEQQDSNAPSPSANDQGNSADSQLVSEPAACPFCVQPEFGVTFTPPPFRRGLTYAQISQNTTSPTSSDCSLASGNHGPQSGGTRRRATSLSANAPGVITTDRIRPDWAHKLATARAHAARRSAAATALHTAAYLVNSPNNESRNPAGGRRSVLRRATHGSEGPGSRAGSQNASTLPPERHMGPEHEHDGTAENTLHLAPPRGSSRRNRMEELEEMMMMEAIRLSLAAEEDRRKKEEKEAKKEAKRRDKETKKAEKYAKKNGLYSNNPSSVALDAGASSASRQLDSGSAFATTTQESSAKGKEIDRSTSFGSTNDSSEPPKLSLGGIEDDQTFSGLHTLSPVEPSKKSQLRHVSSVSTSSSSLVESASGEHQGSRTPPHEASDAAEPMYNFRSLAEVIGDEEKDANASEHVEHTKPQQHEQNEASNKPGSLSGTNQDAEISNDSRPSHDPEHDSGPLEQKELQTRSLEVLPDTVGNLEPTR